jgi:hypothetical protein
MTGFGWTEGRCWFWRERDMRTNQGGVSLTRETSRTRGTRDKIGDRHKNPPQSVLSRRQMALLRISHFHSVAAICWTINGLVAGTQFGAEAKSWFRCKGDSLRIQDSAIHRCTNEVMPCIALNTRKTIHQSGGVLENSCCLSHKNGMGTVARGNGEMAVPTSDRF